MSIEQLKSLASKKRGFARSNLFQVTLPSIPGFNKYSGGDLNILCTNVNLPGRQILTQERLIGIKGRKMPNGFASDDVSMTFYCLNDYGIKEYFEKWQDRVINQATHSIGYTTDYCRDIRIRQLERGSGGKRKLGEIDVPSFDVGIFSVNVDINLFTSTKTVYECVLLDAFPTTMNPIELNNEQDGLVQLNVQLSYRNWKKA